jgi:hypothetical protein
MPADSQAGEGLRDRISARGEEAIGEVAQILLENPLFNQALQAVFGAREIAAQATAQAMRNLNLPTSADVDRLGRRLRALSDRLDAVEDRLDELSRDFAALRRQRELSS